MRHAIRTVWEANGRYGLALVADLRDDQMTAQPVPGVTMNHASWVLAHLNVYAPIASAMLRREPFDDPADHRYGRKSKVINDPREYPAMSQLVSDYAMLHADTLAALDEADDAVFGEPTPLERWRNAQPRVGDMLVSLMVKHESTHLGQLSAWRRALGLPPVSA